MIEEAGSGRQKERPASHRCLSILGQEAGPWVQVGACLFIDLFSHCGGGRFFLRRGAFIVPLGARHNFFLVGSPTCREGAASVGATVALYASTQACMPSGDSISKPASFPIRTKDLAMPKLAGSCNSRSRRLAACGVKRASSCLACGNWYTRSTKCQKARNSWIISAPSPLSVMTLRGKRS